MQQPIILWVFVHGQKKSENKLSNETLYRLNRVKNNITQIVKKKTPKTVLANE